MEEDRSPIDPAARQGSSLGRNHPSRTERVARARDPKAGVVSIALVSSTAVAVAVAVGELVVAVVAEVSM